MNGYNNKAIIIIISLCLIMFAGCKSDQPPTPPAPLQPDTASSSTTDAAVATNNTTVAPPPLPLSAKTTSKLPLGAAPPQPAGAPPPQNVAPGTEAKSSGTSASQDPVEVKAVEAQFVLKAGSWQVLGELKNSSGKRLQKIELTTFLLDDKGKSLVEQKVDLPPILIPSVPGESKRFSINVNPPSGWQGKTAVKVTHLEF